MRNKGIKIKGKVAKKKERKTLLTGGKVVRRVWKNPAVSLVYCLYSNCLCMPFVTDDKILIILISMAHVSAFFGFFIVIAPATLPLLEVEISLNNGMSHNNMFCRLSVHNHF